MVGPLGLSELTDQFIPNIVHTCRHGKFALTNSSKSALQLKLNHARMAVLVVLDFVPARKMCDLGASWIPGEHGVS